MTFSIVRGICTLLLAHVVTLVSVAIVISAVSLVGDGARAAGNAFKLAIAYQVIMTPVMLGAAALWYPILLLASRAESLLSLAAILSTPFSLIALIFVVQSVQVLLGDRAEIEVPRVRPDLYFLLLPLFAAFHTFIDRRWGAFALKMRRVPRSG